MKMNLINTVVRNWRMFIIRIFPESYNRNSQFPELCMVADYNARNQMPSSNLNNLQSILDDIIGDGFLYAVPKKRRSLERKMTRRMGFGKMILPKRNLVVCDACGHFHPLHTVCGNCYEKVKDETKLMQDVVMQELKLDPIDREVVIVYENDPKDSDILNGKIIVEVPKTRPSWFSNNLLAKDSEFPRKKNEAVSETSFAVEVDPTQKSS